MSDLEFEKELCAMINRRGIDNNFNTPDFMIAAYLRNCLNALGETIKTREQWYEGREVPLGTIYGPSNG